MKQHFKTLLFLLPFFLSFVMPVSAFDGADAAGVIQNPIIETVLAAVILISIAAEIKTAGFSGGALAAAIAGCILIGANWYEEESFFWEFILYFGGLVLIFLDIFLLMSAPVYYAGWYWSWAAFSSPSAETRELFIFCPFPFWHRLWASISFWAVWKAVVYGRN